MFIRELFEYLTAAFFARRQGGQGMVEYALILGLISIVAIAVLLLMGPQITAIFSRASNELNAANR
jgi:pilus assembly protein Flp/PilA